MWTLRSEDRLAEWKEFRTFISCLPFEEAVEKTVHYWSYAPFVNHYLDQRPVQDWPTPWELLVDGKYDELAKAVGMLYTLVLSSHGKSHTFSISQVQNGLDNSYIVLIDDGKFVLNYLFNEVTDKEHLSSDITVCRTYSAEDLQLSKY